jgi:hypothetical protein
VRRTGGRAGTTQGISADPSNTRPSMPAIASPRLTVARPARLDTCAYGPDVSALYASDAPHVVAARDQTLAKLAAEVDLLRSLETLREAAAAVAADRTLGTPLAEAARRAPAVVEAGLRLDLRPPGRTSGTATGAASHAAGPQTPQTPQTPRRTDGPPAPSTSPPPDGSPG